MHLPRSSGILLHPTSLPGEYGMGDMGPEAFRFIDWLKSAGQRVWQVLPLGPTGYGDSPYAPFSSFAGNELLVSPDLLVRDGLLSAEEAAAARLPASSRVDYGAAIPKKRALVRLAASRFAASAQGAERLAAFRATHAEWLDDYALFIDIKEEYDDKAGSESAADSTWNAYWPEALARRSPDAMAERRRMRAASIAAIEAAQCLFRYQWDGLRGYAAAQGVRVLGDVPIFVAMDSADAWSRPDLFLLDDSGKPTSVAGVPPDYFSADGQLWGNPLYDWERHEADGFSWWISRVASALSLYDMVRIDHFRGLSACWAVPSGEATARKGTWVPAPGEALLAALAQKLGDDLPIIAEDLGFITDDVRRLRDGFGLPGMRILQFGFDAEESGKGLDPDNPFLPHNYSPDCVAYTGTHDNDTLAGWLAAASREELDFVEAYLGYRPGDAARALMREAMKSAAGLTVFPMQDVLGLGSGARMNTPGTVGGNWTWRLSAGDLDRPTAAGLRAMAAMYGRLASSVTEPVDGPEASRHPSL